MAINITERAGEKIRFLIIDQAADIINSKLRISVKSGGCSGLSYDMSFDETINEGDKVFEHEFGGSIVVDAKSYFYINGMTLDYKESIANNGFIFNNPNAVGSCGCGKSFTV